MLNKHFSIEYSHDKSSTGFWNKFISTVSFWPQLRIDNTPEFILLKQVKSIDKKGTNLGFINQETSNIGRQEITI